MLAALVTLLLATVTSAEVTFRVTQPEASDSFVPAESGRLVVYVVDEGGAVWRQDPSDGPFWQEPEPIFGKTVDHWQPGTAVTITDAEAGEDSFLPNLKPGKYKAQAVLDRHHLDSNWSREPGNVFGPVVDFEVKEGGDVTVELTLNEEIGRIPFAQDRWSRGNGEVIEVESKLMPGVTMRAFVLVPTNMEEGRQYPAIYGVPGFGGTHVQGVGMARQQDLRENAFIIGLNPESKNGHTLFNDSAVNGPRGKMLVEELIPALEEKFPLIAEASARIVTGHSSGGWSSLWLATEYPETFGACWSSGPDPVDFRRFELVDIYESPSFFVDADGRDYPSCRYDLDDDGTYDATLTVRQETSGENVLGPGNTSDATVPGFVWGIIASLFVFFNCFAVVQWLQYRAKGKWADYLRGERVYIALSLIAKTALAWQVFAGALAS